jgi:hypothetical protein
MNFYPTNNAAISRTLCALLKCIGCKALVNPNGINHGPVKDYPSLIELSALAMESFEQGFRDFDPNQSWIDKPENVIVPEDQSDLAKLTQMLSCLRVESRIGTVDGKKALFAFAVKGQVLTLMQAIARNS